MLMQLQAYDINLVYKKGSEMYIADALSRAFPPEIIPEQFEADIASERFIHLMSSESYVTDRKLQTIKDEIHTITQQCNCWPNRYKTGDQITRYWFQVKYNRTSHTAKN